MTEKEYREFNAKITELDKGNQIGEIIRLITALPKEDLTDELISELERAYNNDEEYQNAYDTLMRVRESQKEKRNWHYRLGYALYYLRRFDEALESFETAAELGDKTEDILDWLKSCALEIKTLNERKRRRENYTPNENPLAGFDASALWDDCDFSKKNYIGEYPTDEIIAKAEKELGYKLPKSYIALCKMHNGGYLAKSCCPCDTPTSWAEDHVGVTGILSIGFDKPCSICGESGSRFMIEEWGYPDIGVAIADCPSAGHDMIFLDYSLCGPQGEPEVVHIDQESGYKITWLANDFEEFIRMLVSEEEYDTSQEDKQQDLEKVRSAPFGEMLSALIEKANADFDIGAKIRKVSEAITEEKGSFALHADPLSKLIYDVEFWLHTNANTKTTREAYLTDYPGLSLSPMVFLLAVMPKPLLLTGWIQPSKMVISEKKAAFCL